MRDEGSSSGVKSQLAQLCSNSVTELIQSAGICQELPLEAAKDLAQRLLRSKQKGDEGSS
jgi:hypothetical protein